MTGQPVSQLDDLPRCWWSGSIAADAAMVRYHDEDWGVQVRHDAALFERLALEAFQAGLSWSTILHKRRAFSDAFRGFDPVVVAAFDAVVATIGNAQAYLRLLDHSPGGFAGYLDRFVPPPPPRRPLGSTATDLPAFTPAALALSKDLKRQGFRFVGPTIVYAFLQSVGWVDDHLPGCFRYQAP
jgi:DNA-3-methyladenine glycosylase I